jgi:hypothetical protein
MAFELALLQCNYPRSPVKSFHNVFAATPKCKGSFQHEIYGFFVSAGVLSKLSLGFLTKTTLFIWDSCSDLQVK